MLESYYVIGNGQLPLAERFTTYNSTSNLGSTQRLCCWCELYILYSLTYQKINGPKISLAVSNKPKMITLGQMTE